MIYRSPYSTDGKVSDVVIQVKGFEMKRSWLNVSSFHFSGHMGKGQRIVGDKKKSFYK